MTKRDLRAAERQQSYWPRAKIVRGWYHEMIATGQQPVIVMFPNSAETLVVKGRPYDPRRDRGRWDFMRANTLKIIKEIRKAEGGPGKEGTLIPEFKMLDLQTNARALSREAAERDVYAKAMLHAVNHCNCELRQMAAIADLIHVASTSKEMDLDEDTLAYSAISLRAGLEETRKHISDLYDRARGKVVE